jgi:hypothetical protein
MDDIKLHPHQQQALDWLKDQPVPEGSTRANLDEVYRTMRELYQQDALDEGEGVGVKPGDTLVIGTPIGGGKSLIVQRLKERTADQRGEIVLMPLGDLRVVDHEAVERAMCEAGYDVTFDTEGRVLNPSAAPKKARIIDHDLLGNPIYDPLDVAILNAPIPQDVVFLGHPDQLPPLREQFATQPRRLKPKMQTDADRLAMARAESKRLAKAAKLQKRGGK